jgi:hypothetical protein
MDTTEQQQAALEATDVQLRHAVNGAISIGIPPAAIVFLLSRMLPDLGLPFDQAIGQVIAAYHRAGVLPPELIGNLSKMIGKAPAEVNGQLAAIGFNPLPSPDDTAPPADAAPGEFQPSVTFDNGRPRCRAMMKLIADGIETQAQCSAYTALYAGQSRGPGADVMCKAHMNRLGG